MGAMIGAVRRRPARQGQITLFSEQPITRARPTSTTSPRCAAWASRWSGRRAVQVVPRPTPSCRAAPSRWASAAAATRSRHADLQAQPRERQQPGAGAAPADQPEQHHQRQPRQQLAGHHRLRRQPAAHRQIIAAMDVPAPPARSRSSAAPCGRPTLRPSCSAWPKRPAPPRCPASRSRGANSCGDRRLAQQQPAGQGAAALARHGQHPRWSPARPAARPAAPATSWWCT